MHVLLDALSLAFIIGGSLFALSAAIGLVRFRDTLGRLHAITKPQTLGLVLAIIGTILHVIGSGNLGVAERGDMGVLFLILVFALFTTPIVGQRFGRIARREGLYDCEHLSRDDTEPRRGA